MRRTVRSGRAGDPYFVGLAVAMLAAFGGGLTDPRGIDHESFAANPPVVTDADFVSPKDDLSLPLATERGLFSDGNLVPADVAAALGEAKTLASVD